MLWIMFFWSTPHVVWASRMWRACYNTQKLPSDLISMKWNRGKIWEIWENISACIQVRLITKVQGMVHLLVCGWLSYAHLHFIKYLALKCFCRIFFFYLLTDRTRLVLVSLFSFYFSTAKGLTPLSDFLAYCVLSGMLKTTKNKDKLGR